MGNSQSGLMTQDTSKGMSFGMTQDSYLDYGARTQGDLLSQVRLGPGNSLGLFKFALFVAHSISPCSNAAFLSSSSPASHPSASSIPASFFLLAQHSITPSPLTPPLPLLRTSTPPKPTLLDSPKPRATRRRRKRGRITNQPKQRESPKTPFLSSLVKTKKLSLLRSYSAYIFACLLFENNSANPLSLHFHQFFSPTTKRTIPSHLQHIPSVCASVCGVPSVCVCVMGGDFFFFSQTVDENEEKRRARCRNKTSFFLSVCVCVFLCFLFVVCV